MLLAPALPLVSPNPRRGRRGPPRERPQAVGSAEAQPPYLTEREILHGLLPGYTFAGCKVGADQLATSRRRQKGSGQTAGDQQNPAARKRSTAQARQYRKQLPFRQSRVNDKKCRLTKNAQRHQEMQSLELEAPMQDNLEDETWRATFAAAEWSP